MMMKTSPRAAAVALFFYTYYCSCYDRSQQQASAWTIPLIGKLQRKSLSYSSSSYSSSSYSSSCLSAAVGIFYGTSTGTTQTCAEKIYEQFGADVAAAPVDVDTLDNGNDDSLGAALASHQALIVGAPTWNTGADTERSGTGWDEWLYSTTMNDDDDDDDTTTMLLKGKKVAVFGLGDQSSYAANYADATGELYDVFSSSLGCDLVDYASTSQEGYEHEDSKSILRDGSNRFCGLLLDEVNQEDLTDGRIAAWVAQLKAGGFVDSADGVLPVSVAAAAPAVVEDLPSTLEQSSAVLDETIAAHSAAAASASDFVPHYNAVTQKTMWTSPDGRQSYVTTAETTAPPPTSLRP